MVSDPKYMRPRSLTPLVPLASRPSFSFMPDDDEKTTGNAWEDLDAALLRVRARRYADSADLAEAEHDAVTRLLPRLTTGLDALVAEVGRERHLDPKTGRRQGPDRQELDDIRQHLHKWLPRLAINCGGAALERILRAFLAQAHSAAMAEQRRYAVRRIAEAVDPDFARVERDRRAWVRQAITMHNAIGEDAFLEALEGGRAMRPYPQHVFTSEQLQWAERKYRAEDPGPYPAAARPPQTAVPCTAEQIIAAGQKARGEVVQLPENEAARAILRAGRRARGEEER